MRWLMIFALSVGAFLMNAGVASAAADLAGTWHFVLDTPGGDRESDADFHVDSDNKVTGKYGKADVAGSFKDGKIDLAFTIETEEAGTGTLKLMGTLDGDAITGNWEFTEYNGTFKASRTKAADTAPTPKPSN